MSEQCVCGAVIDQEECQCSVQSTDTVQVDGSGRTGNPLLFYPKLDPDPDNLITCESDGLLMAPPTELSDPPQCHATRNSNLSVANRTLTVVTLNQDRYDTDSMHSIVTDTERIVFNTPGVYLCTLSAAWDNSVLTGDRSARIKKNGRSLLAGAERRALGITTENLGLQVCAVEYFEQGEYIHAEVQQSSGGALNLLSTRYSPNLTAKWLRGNPLD